MVKRTDRILLPASLQRKKRWLMALTVCGVVILLCVAVLFIPAVNERITRQLRTWQTKLAYAINPPQQVVFSPQQQAAIDLIVTQTVAAMQLEAPPQGAVTLDVFTPTATIMSTPTLTPTVTATFAPIPVEVDLKGVVHEYQKFNNCGPATLSMALSYWGWQGDQLVTGDYLRPNKDDRNTLPQELADYVNTQTSLRAVLRWAGDLDMIKRLVAAGFPVLIEQGFEDEHPEDGWMGHYGLITGYSDPRGKFIFQDSYVMADYPIAYERVQKHWQAFNDVFVVIYPPERESDVMTVLGAHADEAYNLAYAVEKASHEITISSGRPLFFAWYNLGTSLTNMKDNAGAAAAYDQAFALYADIPEEQRPWRMNWYQMGAYEAYYETGRYQDVINLVYNTLVTTTVPSIEECWLWRGRAHAALGNTNDAISNFRQALVWHPGYQAALDALALLGVAP